MVEKDEWKRFHNFFVFSPARKGVDGLRSHKRGSARRALIGVNLKEFSGAGSLVPLQKEHAQMRSRLVTWR